MKYKTTGLIFLGIVMLLSAIAIFKPALAMAPPPASRIWLWKWLQNPTGKSQLLTVTVTWPEGTRTETVTLKAVLKDVSP